MQSLSLICSSCGGSKPQNDASSPQRAAEHEESQDGEDSIFDQDPTMFPNRGDSHPSSIQHRWSAVSCFSFQILDKDRAPSLPQSILLCCEFQIGGLPNFKLDDSPLRCGSGSIDRLSIGYNTTTAEMGCPESKCDKLWCCSRVGSRTWCVHFFLP